MNTLAAVLKLINYHLPQADTPDFFNGLSTHTKHN